MDHPSKSTLTPNYKNSDVSSIKGNISDDLKRLGQAAWDFFVSTEDKSYGANIGKRLKFVEMNIWGEGGLSYAETVCFITIEKDLCNIFGTLHGACAAYIVDHCSVSSLVLLGASLGLDGGGVSQSMNLIWHKPVQMGTKLRVVSTSLSMKGRIRTARCELWDNDVLCVSGIHSTVNPGGPAARASKAKL